MKRRFVRPLIMHLGTQQNVVAAVAAVLKCCSSAAEAALEAEAG